MPRFVREQSLSIFFGLLFLGALAGQAIAGHADHNQDLREHHEHSISFGRYIVSSSFGRAMLENWQSEYLQFLLFALATVWFLQKGSPESKELDKAGPESDKDQMIGEHAKRDSPLWARVGGIRTAIDPMARNSDCQFCSVRFQKSGVATYCAQLSAACWWSNCSAL